MTEFRCYGCGIIKKEGIAMIHLNGDFYCGECLLKLIDKMKQNNRRWIQENE